MIRIPYPRADSWLGHEQRAWERTGDARHDSEGAFATIVSMGDATRYDTNGGAKIHRKGNHFLEQLAPKEFDKVIARLQQITREQANANKPVPPLSVRAHLTCLVYDLDHGNYALDFVLYVAYVGQTILRQHYHWHSSVVVDGRIECNKPRKYRLHFPQTPDLNDLHSHLWSLVRAHVGGQLCDVARSRSQRLHGTAHRHGASHNGIYRVLSGFHSDATPMPLGAERAAAAALCSGRLGADQLRHFMQTCAYPRARTHFAAAAALGAREQTPRSGGVAQPFIDACAPAARCCCTAPTGCCAKRTARASSDAWRTSRCASTASCTAGRSTSATRRPRLSRCRARRCPPTRRQA